MQVLTKFSVFFFSTDFPFPLDVLRNQEITIIQEQFAQFMRRKQVPCGLVVPVIHFCDLCDPCDSCKHGVVVDF